MSISKLVGLITHGRASALSDKGIKSFESETGFALPVDYRGFLTSSNGGELRESLEARWVSALYQGGYGNAVVSRFYSIGDSGHQNVRPLTTVFKEMEVSVSDVPNGIFVIGEDDLGNQITIDLRSKNRGQIALVDHETVGDHFSDEETYQVVANSFEEFVRMLHAGNQG